MNRQILWNVAGIVGAVSLAIAALALEPQSDPKKRVVLVLGTLEAAPAQPMVHVQLRRGRHILKAPAEGEPEKTATSFLAYLNTGDTGYVLSTDTADRFGVKRQHDTVYQAVALRGMRAMYVSETYSVALGSTTGQFANDQSPPKRLLNGQREIAMQINPSEPDSLMATLGSIDVVGMPAIRRAVMEIDPTPMRKSPTPPSLTDPAPAGVDPLDIDLDDLEDLEELQKMLEELQKQLQNPGEGGGADHLLRKLGTNLLGNGPAVHVHPSSRRPRRVDVVIPLEYIDYNLRDSPDNRGALPELEASPMIMTVESRLGSNTFEGDWLLNTGAASSFISTRQAQALGLLDEHGQPTREPAFHLTLGGIGGQSQRANGFILDSVRIPARKNMVLEFRNVHVVVHDVGSRRNDGTEVILDAVLGMNMLLPSVAGLDPQKMLTGQKMERYVGAFDRIWIDGPRGTLSLQLRK